MPQLQDHLHERLLAHARYLGADAALAAASWLILSETQARSILDDIDPEVVDAIGEPNLSGEWADDPTPGNLYYEVTGETDPGDGDLVAELCDAWEEGRDLVWADALQAVALRTLGDVIRALDVEQRNEHNIKVLREGPQDRRGLLA